MDYIKLRKIAKFQVGGKAKAIADFKANHASELTGYETDDMVWNMIMALPIDDSEPEEIFPDDLKQWQFLLDEMASKGMSNEDLKAANADLSSRGMITSIPETSDSPIEGKVTGKPSAFGQKAGAAAAAIAGSLGKFAVDLGKQELSALGGQMGEIGVSSMELGILALKLGNKDGLANLYGGAVTAAMGVAENELMGDKNFGAQSAAIDLTVHGASKALMSSGNPFCVCKGTLVYTKEGYKKIEDLSIEDKVLGYSDDKFPVFEKVEKVALPHEKECIEILTECGNVLRCSIDHPIYSALEGRARYITIGKKKQRRIKDFKFREASSLKIGDMVAEIGEIPFFGNQTIKDAYLIGLLIGDGTYGKGKLPRLFTGDPDTWSFIETKTSGKLQKQYIDKTRYNSEFREYKFPGFLAVLREHGIYTQTKKNKRLPIDIEKWDKLSCARLIAGLIDTDGCVLSNSKDHSEIFFYQSNKILLLLVKRLLLKFGIHSTIKESKAITNNIKGKVVNTGTKYALIIKRKSSIINFYNNIQLNIKYKLNALYKAFLLKSDCKERDTSYEFHNVIADKIKKIVYLGKAQVYNILVSGSHTFIADNIVTHNCALAGAALEGANFLTKAGGQTVQGFDVNIDNSGYGNLGHMESSSSRDFGTLIGLGGLTDSKMELKLARRNQQARMALKAAAISEDQSFEQEARRNSVTNTIMQNQQALSGGIDLSNI